MSLYRQQYTKPVPKDAELFTKAGQRMARWRDRRGKQHTCRVTTGADGKPRLLRESKFWYASYRDHTGAQIDRSTECKDEQAARQVLAKWEKEVERIRAGVLTPAEEKMTRIQQEPIETHFLAYHEHLEAEGTTRIHREDTLRYLRRLAGDCTLTRLADLDLGALEKWLAARTREKMSARSRNAYRNALVAFCNWCVRTKRLASNPLASAPRANEKADPRRKRRAMTEDELTRLLAVARERPMLENLTVRRGKKAGQRYANLRPVTKERLEQLGQERAIVYKTLVLTGLRRNELATLTVGQLVLDHEQPHLQLDAADEKSREGNAVAIRPDLAEDLRGWLAGKLSQLQAESRDSGGPIPLHLPPETLVFRIPKSLRLVMNRDLKMAGIPKKDDRGRTLDVHAVRHTFGTLLSVTGASPRTAQAAMRHSTIDLTMNVYTDPRLLEVHAAIGRLPALPLGSSPDSANRGLTPLLTPGTDSGRQEQSSAGKSEEEDESDEDDASDCPDKRKGRLSFADNRPSMSGRLDLNQRPPEPHSGASASQVLAGQGTCAETDKRLPECLPSEVLRIAMAWEALPAHIQASILALVSAGQTKKVA